MKKSVVFFLAFFLMSCGVNKEVATTTEVEHSSVAVPEKNVPKAIIGEAPENNPNTEITSAFIEEDILFLTVNYSGGCEEHVFDLVGDAVVMKSFPPQRSIVLVRNDRGDTCREWITKEIMFELSEFQYASSGQNEGEIILHLEKWSESLRYIYKK